MPKKFLLFLIVLFLFSFLIQQTTSIFKIRKLDGVSIKTELDSIKFDSLWTGKSQTNINEWANENFGFRNALVRLHNQLGFWMYKHSYTNAVVVGKENYLLDKTYIDAYTGADFVGEKTIKEKTVLIKKLQDSLSAHGIKFFFVFAPGKASFYSEYIPDSYLKTKQTGNYERYKSNFDQLGIEYLDFRNWFAYLKTETKYPLFPKCGIHWSTYGAALAADSIIKHIEKLTKTDLANIKLDPIIVKNELNEVDQDVGKSMNLIWDISNNPMAYPTLSYSKTSKALNVLTIADSYYWTMPVKSMSEFVFNQMNFIYYNKQLFTNNGGKPYEEEYIHRPRLILDQDVIIVLATDANLDELGWDFFEKTYYNLFEAKTKSGLKIPLDVIIQMEDIKFDKKWYAIEMEKAKTQNITIDSMLYIDAQYILKLTKDSK